MIESTGNLEFYKNVDDLDVDYPDPVEAVPDSTYYVYQSVPEKVEEYKEDSQVEDLIEEDKEEIKEEEVEKEEEEEKDVKEVQYVYIKSNSVSDNDVVNDNHSAETVIVNEAQYLIDTPLIEYNLTDSLLLIIILMGLFFGLVQIIRRSLLKWN